MKKLILNISDIDFERLCFEAIEKKCNLGTIIKERIFYQPFSESVENEIDRVINESINQVFLEI